MATLERNATSIGQSIFMSEPAGRGTWGILFSCTATLVFCVWTAIHPDILGPNRRTGYQLFYKGLLTLIALICPEGIVIFSVGQVIRARSLQNRANEILRKKHDKEMGLEEAFFVIMGGFVVPAGTEAITPEPEGLMALTSQGFLEFLERGLIGSDKDSMKSRKREIVDRGKSSNIAKVVAGCQAMWLFIQCFIRKVSGLPLTLLEIHVAIQVILTAIMYICWWHKPLDVQQPIKIDLHTDTPPVPDGKLYAKICEKDEPYVRILSKSCFDLIGELDPDRFALPEKKPDEKDSDLEEGLLVPSTSSSSSELSEPPLTPKTASTLSAALLQSWKSTCSLKTGRGFMMFIEGAIIAIAGAGHTAAWNVDFPTSTEATLWRISSIGSVLLPLAIVALVSTSHYQHVLIDAVRDGQYKDDDCKDGVFWFAVYKIDKGARKIAGDHDEKDWPACWRIFHWAIMLFALFLIGLYALCVVYILVESYISIRRPPERSFETPRWSDYWPHL